MDRVLARFADGLGLLAPFAFLAVLLIRWSALSTLEGSRTFALLPSAVLAAAGAIVLVRGLRSRHSAEARRNVLERALGGLLMLGAAGLLVLLPG